MKSVFTLFFSNLPETLLHYLPLLCSTILILGASVVCSGCYTLKQGSTMLGYLNRAIPLESIAADEEAPEEDRLFVQRVENIRRFAIEDLGLKESKNYTRYVELDRDYLAAIVSASAKDSFTRHEWWFPVVGRVPYKGFFNAEDARKERKKLEKKDLDVWIRGVDAFSTLGWFRDPLYSYMKNYSERSLADLIIHELLHATVYLKSHSQFNEELAEFIGTEGARLYIEKLRAGAKGSLSAGEDSAETRLNESDAKTDGETFRAFIRGLIEELDLMYKSEISRDEKLRRKEEIISEAKQKFKENYDTMFLTDNYRNFTDLPVNNAYLELYRLYYGEDLYFKELYEKSGSDLPRFIAAAKAIKVKRNGDPKAEFEKALGL